MINYVLDMYTPEGFKFIFDDERYTIIDLVKDFPRYRVPESKVNEQMCYYTVKEVDINYDNIHKNKYQVGDVLYIDKKARFKFFSKDGILFKKTTQSELDYYEYKKGINTDNAKVYKTIKKLLSKKIKETTL